MNCQATAICAGRTACDLLRKPAYGVVFAVFQRTFYLKTKGYLDNPGHLENGSNDQQSSDLRAKSVRQSSAGGVLTKTQQLCCIGLQELVPGPLNVSTSFLQLPPLVVGSQWYSSQQHLKIGTVAITFAETRVWQPPNTHQHLQPFSNAVAWLAEFIESNPRHRAENKQTQNQRIDEAIERQLENASSQLGKWLCNESGDTPTTSFPVNLLGCGKGLTPAGDDILVGLLLAMRSWRQPQLGKLIEKVKHLVGSTGDISAAHLLAACDGAGIAPLHNLIAVVSSHSSSYDQSQLKQQIISTAQVLYQYGHSSGYYAMKGVLLAAECHAVCVSVKQ